jgi:hypothetical protein
MALIILFVKTLFVDSYLIILHIVVGVITYFLTMLAFKGELTKEILTIFFQCYEKTFKITRIQIS